MNTTKAILGALIAVAHLAPASAQAACAQADLEGRWRAYMLGILAGRGFVQECPLAITEDGDIEPAECLTVTLSTDGLELARNCRLTGNFILEPPAGAPFQCDVSAQMSINTEVVSGRVQCDAPGPVLMLSMIKR